MTSRDGPSSTNDNDHLDQPLEISPLELAEAAEEEAAAAEAEARAATARARAIRLRHQAEVVPADSTACEASPASIAAPRRWRLHRPPRKAAAVGATTLLICASLAASGYMVWHHHIAAQERQRTAEFAAAARQAAVTLMSLDSSKTKQDIDRISDISTGKFKDRFPMIAAQLSNGLQQSKVVVTTVTVNDVAVETMTDHSAIVLLAATTNAKKPDGADEPGYWHIAMALTKDGGKPKISNVEFVQ